MSKMSPCLNKLYSNAQTFRPSSVHVRGIQTVPKITGGGGIQSEIRVNQEIKPSFISEFCIQFGSFLSSLTSFSGSKW